MGKLSTIIIAKNAEDQIADAISSVSFADEVIVVDNASTDRTREIATYLKAKVFFKKTTDFSLLRNFGLEKAICEWVLYIDADERVSDGLRKSIQSQIITSQSGMTVYRIYRKNFYLGNNTWPYIEKLERLFKKSSFKGWKGKLHESPIITGSVGQLEGFLLHFTHRDLASMLAKTIEWSEVEAQLRLKVHHPPMNIFRFFRVMGTAFWNSYVKQKGWKVGTVGLIESLYQAFSIFITYARLWELQERNNEKE